MLITIQSHYSAETYEAQGEFWCSSKAICLFFYTISNAIKQAKQALL